LITAQVTLLRRHETFRNSHDTDTGRYRSVQPRQRAGIRSTPNPALRTMRHQTIHRAGTGDPNRAHSGPGARQGAWGEAATAAGRTRPNPTAHLVGTERKGLMRKYDLVDRTTPRPLRH